MLKLQNASNVLVDWFFSDKGIHNQNFTILSHRIHNSKEYEAGLACSTNLKRNFCFVIWWRQENTIKYLIEKILQLCVTVYIHMFLCLWTEWELNVCECVRSRTNVSKCVRTRQNASRSGRGALFIHPSNYSTQCVQCVVLNTGKCAEQCVGWDASQGNNAIAWEFITHCVLHKLSTAPLPSLTAEIWTHIPSGGKQKQHSSVQR